MGSTYITKSECTLKLWPVYCNRSHVSTFVHCLEIQALSGNDQGEIDLSLRISFKLKVMLAE